MKSKKEIEPTEKQIDYCEQIAKAMGSCDADENGQPIYELSMEHADQFIKKNRHVLGNGCEPHEPQGNAGDWGIPNH